MIAREAVQAAVRYKKPTQRPCESLGLINCDEECKAIEEHVVTLRIKINHSHTITPTFRHRRPGS